MRKGVDGLRAIGHGVVMGIGDMNMDKAELGALADLLARLQSKIDAAYASKPSFGGPVTDEDCTTISLGDLRLVIDNVPAIIEQRAEIERFHDALLEIAREALRRQVTNMNFLLTHSKTPRWLVDKMTTELEADRNALATIGGNNA